MLSKIAPKSERENSGLKFGCTKSLADEKIALQNRIVAPRLSMFSC